MVDGLKTAMRIIEDRMESNLESFRGMMYSQVVNEPILEIYEQIKCELKLHSLTDGVTDNSKSSCRLT